MKSRTNEVNAKQKREPAKTRKRFFGGMVVLTVVEILCLRLTSLQQNRHPENVWLLKLVPFGEKRVLWDILL